MRRFRLSIAASLLIASACLSACLTGGGSTGVGPSSGAAGGSFLPSGGSTPDMPSPLASAGGDTMHPRSEMTDGLQGGELELVAYRVFLSPKPYNTQELNEMFPVALEAKGVLNLNFTAQGALKALNAETDEWTGLGWMTFGIGPYLRIVKTSALSLSSATAALYQDQMALYMEAGDKGYNGVIKNLPVTEGDTVSIYAYNEENPKGTSAEEYFVKPPNFSETLTAFAEGGLAAFASNPKTHLLVRFDIKSPAPATSAPQMMRRSNDLPDFSDYLVK